MHSISKVNGRYFETVSINKYLFSYVSLNGSRCQNSFWFEIVILNSTEKRFKMFTEKNEVTEFLSYP